MEPVVYQYKCDKTGKTYTLDSQKNSAGKPSDVSTVKLEVFCQDCGGKHLIFAGEKT